MIIRNPVKAALMAAIIASPGILSTNLWGQASTSITRPRSKPTQQVAGEFPESWYIFRGNQARRPAQLRKMEGKPAPGLFVEEWHGEPFDLETMKGKIVVVDFWATWCGPCVKALPKNVSLADKYRDDGVIVIGIHDAKNGWNRVPAMDRRMRFNYPIGKDDSQKSQRVWNVPFWPTYGVIDRKGILRAAGLRPEFIEKVVIRLLDEDPLESKKPTPETAEPKTEASEPKAAAEKKPRNKPGDNTVFKSMLEGGPRQRAAFTKLMAAKTPPKISAKSWENSEPLFLENLKGKVVMLDFWATWCRPCIKNIPKINKLHEKYASDGLVIIGVCHTKGAESMTAFVNRRGIKYPVCADRLGITNAAYKVNSLPDYYLIDRQGKLRIADCKSDSLEDAIKILLAEESPGSAS